MAILPSCGIMMHQSCQKVLLELTQLCIQSFTSSSLPFFPSRCQSRYLFNWSKLFVFKNFKIWSLHRSWNPDRPEVAIVNLVETYPEIPTRPSRKLQLWILLSGSELMLSYHFMTLTMKIFWFYSLCWLEFFHQDLHPQLFSLENVFF